MKLRGAAAIVTGGAGGIGAATVAHLRAAGARVAIVDRDVEAVDSDAADHVVQADLVDDEQAASAIRECAEVLGALDVAVFAAGTGGFSRIDQLDLDAWDAVHALNVRAGALCIRECARAMREAGRRGAIVAVSSISGRLAERGMAHYGASKAALDHLVRVAARELGPHGIRVNAIAPGTTDTPMFAATDRNPGYRERVIARTPLGRLGTPDDIAAAIVAIAQLDWVTGQILAADGGLSLFSPIDPLER